MPITVGKFQRGDIPSRTNIQDNILLVLKENSNTAFSSIELENMFNVRRQAINQALRALDKKGLVERKFIKIGSRNVAHAIIKKGKGKVGD